MILVVGAHAGDYGFPLPNLVFINREWLEMLIPQIRQFLQERLKLELHPDKLFLKALASGVDFLGWVNFPDHRVLRTTTKRRMMRRLEESQSKETVASYLGMLSHGNTEKIKVKVLNFISANARG